MKEASTGLRRCWLKRTTTRATSSMSVMVCGVRMTRAASVSSSSITASMAAA